MSANDQKDDGQWWACPTCGGDTRICRGKHVATTRECIDCDWSVTLDGTEETNSESDLDEKASDGGEENDIAEVLMMIPALFDSDASTEDRLRGGLVLGTLLGVVGYWVFLTVM